jgi:Tfp pilus assembly protein PilX
MTGSRGDRGSALMMALAIMLVGLLIGSALLATAIAQQHQAGNQQQSETAYSLAEAALNAEVFALSQQWPTSADAPEPLNSPGYGYPTRCNAAMNGTSYCPAPADLSAYSSGSQTCPAGTPGDAWNTGSVTNGWTTYVRDAGAPGSSTQALFSSSAEKIMAPFNASVDSKGGGSVWVRAVGIVNCHIAVLVTKVSDQVGSLSFPKFVLDANSFTTSDNGQKDILNVQDTNGNTSQISLRCAGTANGNGAQPPNATCAGAQNPTQIQPVASYASPPAGSPTLNASQLAAVKKLAIEKGTYICASPSCASSGHSPVSCSSITAAQLQGSPVYIDGDASCYGNGDIRVPSNPTINTLSAPGFLVIVDGSIEFTGSATYYGVIYAPNPAGHSGNILTLGGTSTIVGGVNVDGNAALTLGSSGNGAVNCTDTGKSQKCGDLEYDAAAFSGLTSFDGAASAPNMFRQLPNNQ